MARPISSDFDVDWNKVLIAVNWGFLVGSIVLTPLNVGAYLLGYIGEEALILVTLILSWLAITLSAASALVAAYVKKDVEES